MLPQGQMSPRGDVECLVRTTVHIFMLNSDAYYGVEVRGSSSFFFKAHFLFEPFESLVHINISYSCVYPVGCVPRPKCRTFFHDATFFR